MGQGRVSIMGFVSSLQTLFAGGWMSWWFMLCRRGEERRSAGWFTGRLVVQGAWCESWKWLSKSSMSGLAKSLEGQE